ncbi:MAG: hypothetical protein AAFV51_11415 [Pseudomonadota bacterium]
MRRRILKKLTIGEVSFVDSPAQTGATLAIAKSAAGPVRPEIAKSFLAELTGAAEATGVLRAALLKTAEEGDPIARLRITAEEVRDGAERALQRMAGELATAAAVPRDEARAALRETATGRRLEEVLDLSEQITRIVGAAA